MTYSRRLLPFLVLLLLPMTALPGQERRNPLARAKPAASSPDPFARTFRGDGLVLTLSPKEGGYQGTLQVEGQRYPVQARRGEDAGLLGTFEVDGEAFEFTGALAGDQLTLTSDGEAHDLRAEATAGEAEAATDQQPRRPPPLAGLYDGPLARWRHPEGYFTLELPKGWTEANAQDGMVVFNPGLKETDTLDCLLLVTFGELEEDERGVPIDRLLDDKEPELRQSMAEQEIQLQRPTAKPHKVRVGELAGAQQTWSGQANGNRLTMWVGGLVVREYYLAVIAVVAQGKEDRFLPGAKRMFTSLQPKPPQRDRQAEAALAGGEFAGGETLAGGSMHTIYRFRGNGTVHRQLLMSGSIGLGTEVGADSADVGRYEVVGPLVYLRFPDGQQAARLVVAAGAVTGLRFGNRLYARR
jgi:hypothetical protein